MQPGFSFRTEQTSKEKSVSIFIELLKFSAFRKRKIPIMVKILISNQTQLSAVTLPMLRSLENKMAVSVNGSPIL